MKVDSPIRHCLHSIIRLDHLITTEHHSNHTVSLVIVLDTINSQEEVSKSYSMATLIWNVLNITWLHMSTGPNCILHIISSVRIVRIQ